MSLGAPELAVVYLVSIVVTIAVLVSVSRYPSSAFYAAQSNKTLWIVLPIVGFFFCGVITWIAAIVWFASVKPRVAAAAA